MYSHDDNASGTCETGTCENVESVVKEIYEPAPSESSLDFINDDVEEEEEEDYVTKQERKIREKAMDTVTRRMNRYKMIRGIHILKIGGPNATMSQLLLLCDLELEDRLLQELLMNIDGVVVIVNMLEVKDVRCNQGALKIISKLATNNKMRLHLTNLGVISNLIALFEKPNDELHTLIADALAALCKILKPARYFRKYGGIPLLINLLDVDESILYTPFEYLTDQERGKIQLLIAVIEALKNLAQHPKSVQVMYRAGLVFYVKKITNSRHKALSIQMIELLDKCMQMAEMRRIMEMEGILLSFVEGLTDPNERLRAASASAIAQCATDSEVARSTVRFLGALPELVMLTKDVRQDRGTISALTLAVARLSQDEHNLREMTEHGLVHNMIKCMKMALADPEITGNVLEALAECGREDVNRKIILGAEVIPFVCNRLQAIETRTASAASMCVGTFSKCPEMAKAIVKFHGLTRLFSNLRSPSPKMVACSLWALRPLLKHTKDAAEEIRSIMGGLDLLIRLLSAKDLDVVAQCCGLITEICSDPENLQILSDTGLVRVLSNCAKDADERIHANVAEAIAASSTLKKNAEDYGAFGAVVTVRNYLVTNDARTHKYALMALSELTRVPLNCVLLYECNGVAIVLRDVGSSCEDVQMLATQVLRNMRKLILDSEWRQMSTCVGGELFGKRMISKRLAKFMRICSCHLCKEVRECGYETCHSIPNLFYIKKYYK